MFNDEHELPELNKQRIEQVADLVLLTEEAGEINALTNKATPVGDDEILIEDSEDSYSKKKLKISNLPTGSTPTYSKPDIYPVADNGFTVGVANVYYSLGYGSEIGFGETTTKLARVSFTVPDNYKSGTDILLYFRSKVSHAASTISSSLYTSAKKNAESHGWDISNGTTYFNKASYASVNTWYDSYFTLPNSILNFQAGDTVMVGFRVIASGTGDRYIYGTGFQAWIEIE